jgi:hypothetical protein
LEKEPRQSPAILLKMMMIAQDDGGITAIGRAFAMLVVGGMTLVAASVHALIYAAYTGPCVLTMRCNRKRRILATPVVTLLGVLVGAFVAAKTSNQTIDESRFGVPMGIAIAISSVLTAIYMLWASRNLVLAAAPLVGMVVFMLFAMVEFWLAACAGWHLAALGMTLAWRFRPLQT